MYQLSVILGPDYPFIFHGFPVDLNLACFDFHSDATGLVQLSRYVVIGIIGNLVRMVSGYGYGPIAFKPRINSSNREVDQTNDLGQTPPGSSRYSRICSSGYQSLLIGLPPHFHATP